MKTKTHLLALPFALLLSLAATGCPSPSDDGPGTRAPVDGGSGDDGEGDSKPACGGSPRLCFEYLPNEFCLEAGCRVDFNSFTHDSDCRGAPHACVRYETQDECELYGCEWGP